MSQSLSRVEDFKSVNPDDPRDIWYFSVGTSEGLSFVKQIQNSRGFIVPTTRIPKFVVDDISAAFFAALGDETSSWSLAWSRQLSTTFLQPSFRQTENFTEYKEQATAPAPFVDPTATTATGSIQDPINTVAGINLTAPAPGASGNEIELIILASSGPTGLPSIQEVDEDVILSTWYDDNTVSDIVAAINIGTNIIASPDGFGTPSTDLFTSLLTAASITLPHQTDLSGGTGINSDIFIDTAATFLTDGILAGQYLELQSTTVANIEIGGAEVTLPHLVQIEEVCSETELKIDGQFTNLVDLTNNTGDVTYSIRSIGTPFLYNPQLEYLMITLYKDSADIDPFDLDKLGVSVAGTVPSLVDYDEQDVLAAFAFISAQQKIRTDDVTPIDIRNSLATGVTGSQNFQFLADGTFRWNVPTSGDGVVFLILSRPPRVS